MLETTLKLAVIRIKEYLVYKSNFILYTLNRVIEVVVYIAVWFAIYNQTGEINGFTINEMTTYYVLVVSLIPLTIWGINEDMATSIRKGQINRELLNPMSYFQYWFGIYLGEFGFGFLTSIATFLICSCIWEIVLPASVLNLILFSLIIILTIPISFFTQVIVGMCGFYTNSTWGMQILRKSVVSIFSGLIAPITMFPIWFQKIANILPFKEFFYEPINVYLGKTQTIDVIFIIIKQLMWIILLYIIVKIFFKKAIKNITINGG